MKLSVKLPVGAPNILTPYLPRSGTSMSSKTPGRDLEDRLRLDKVPEVGSWWNFLWSFLLMIISSWHHPHPGQEPPYPPRLQEGTYRTDWVLTRFLKSDLDETFCEASYWWSYHLDTISTQVKNLHVLQDSLKGLRGQVSEVGSWWNLSLIHIWRCRRRG